VELDGGASMVLNQLLLVGKVANAKLGFTATWTENFGCSRKKKLLGHRKNLFLFFGRSKEQIREHIMHEPVRFFYLALGSLWRAYDNMRKLVWY
jgi:hypothetical protein